MTSNYLLAYVFQSDVSLQKQVHYNKQYKVHSTALPFNDICIHKYMYWFVLSKWKNA